MSAREARRVKILLSGYYGFGNLGDEALLAGLLSALRSPFEPSLRVLSRAPRSTTALHGVGAEDRLRGLATLVRPSLLVSGGGGLLQDKTSRRSLHYYLGVIALARRLGRRVIVYGQSVGPLSPAGEKAVARALRGLPIAVRDEPSQRLLARLELSATLVADPALLLPRPAATPSVDAPVLLIPRAGYPEVTEALKGLALELRRHTIPVAGLAFHPEEDGAALAELRAALPTLTLLSAATPQAALEHIARSRHVVSARLHGLILAARARRPLSGIAYDPKVAAFLSEVGANVHTLRPDPAALMAEITTPHLDEARVSALEVRSQRGVLWLKTQLERACQT